jgi:hypothetical protein
LRSLTDTRIFDFADFITLDDGEAPLLDLMEHISGSRKLEALKRTFALTDARSSFSTVQKHRIPIRKKQTHRITPIFR